MEELRRESCIRGYKEIRNPFLGEVLQFERDPHNVVDRYSVAVKKGVVVGHLQRKVSRLCSFFLTEMGHNRLHSNWSKKTLRRSTPRRPEPEVLVTNCDLVYLVPTVLNFHVEKHSCCKYFVRLIFVWQQRK